MEVVKIGDKWAVLKLCSVGSHYVMWHFGLRQWIWNFYASCLTDEATAKKFVEQNKPER